MLNPSKPAPPPIPRQQMTQFNADPALQQLDEAVQTAAAPAAAA